MTNHQQSRAKQARLSPISPEMTATGVGGENLWRSGTRLPLGVALAQFFFPVSQNFRVKSPKLLKNPNPKVPEFAVFSSGRASAEREVLIEIPNFKNVENLCSAGGSYEATTRTNERKTHE